MAVEWPAVVEEAYVDGLEAVSEVFRQSVLELLRVSVLEEVLVLLQAILKQLWQFYFDITRDFVTIDSVSIAHGEQVKALLAAHVWRQRVCVLIDLVWVARLVTARRSERKLRDGIESLPVRRVELLPACCGRVVIAILLLVALVWLLDVLVRATSRRESIEGRCDGEALPSSFVPFTLKPGN